MLSGSLAAAVGILLLTLPAGALPALRELDNALSRSADTIDELVLIDPDTGARWDPTPAADADADADVMPARLTVSFRLYGVERLLEVEKQRIVSDNYRELILAPSGGPGGKGNTTAGLEGWRHAHPEAALPGGRRRRAGPRNKRVDLDCFYHGIVAGIPESRVALSACELPMAVHAAVRIPDDRDAGRFNASFEIQPVAGGGHLGYLVSDLEDGGGTCGLDEADGGHHHHHHNHHAQARGRRQACTKTVEVLILNDESLYSRSGANTESFSAQVFNSMAGLYADGSFACSIQLRLVGQITFRHGTPAAIQQRNCNQAWFYNSLPTASNNACCGGNICTDCPAGETTCLVRPAACESSTIGCYSSSSSWGQCGNRVRRRVNQIAYTNGQCALNSNSALEVDHNLMLATLGIWISDNKVALESVFLGTIDNVLLFSGKDFGSSTVGLAGVGTMCRGGNPASSVNQIRSASAMTNALTTTHEMGHNFGRLTLTLTLTATPRASQSATHRAKLSRARCRSCPFWRQAL